MALRRLAVCAAAVNLRVALPRAQRFSNAGRKMSYANLNPSRRRAAYSFPGRNRAFHPVVSGVLRGRDERGRRVLHVDVDDGVDDLVAPRLVETGMQPLVERMGETNPARSSIVSTNALIRRAFVVILTQTVAEAQLVHPILDRGEVARQRARRRGNAAALR